MKSANDDNQWPGNLAHETRGLLFVDEWLNFIRASGDHNAQIIGQICINMMRQSEVLGRSAALLCIMPLKAATTGSFDSKLVAELLATQFRTLSEIRPVWPPPAATVMTAATTKGASLGVPTAPAPVG